MYNIHHIRHVLLIAKEVILMRRTQIYLDEEIYDIVKKESKLLGKSASQIIRENLKDSILNRQQKIINAIDNSKGAWKDKTNFEVNSFIRKLRKGNRIDNL
jgi:negative regulator of replication initiation